MGVFSQLANCNSNYAKPSGDTHAIFKNDQKTAEGFSSHCTQFLKTFYLQVLKMNNRTVFVNGHV